MTKTKIRVVAASAALLASAAARAAVVFPGASGIGLEPPPGMKPARTFDGFQAGPASILISELPPAAYAQINSSRDMFISRFQAKHADDVDVNGAHGFVVRGSQTVGQAQFDKWVLVLDGKTDTAVVSAQVPIGDQTVTQAQIEAALRTVTFRPKPGLDSQVAALPFAVGDLAGFRVSGTAFGAALILVDGDKDVDPTLSQAHIVVTANDGAAPQTDRAAYAKAQLQAFQAVRTTEITSAKLFDADGVQWAQVEAKGSEGQAETPVAITFFMRFDKAGTLSILCVAPNGQGAAFAGKFKTVALAVKPKG